MSGRFEKRMAREREAQERRNAEHVAKLREDGRAFRLELQALCLKYGLNLEAIANCSANVSCDPQIEIVRLNQGETPELIDRWFD